MMRKLAINVLYTFTSDSQPGGDKSEEYTDLSFALTSPSPLNWEKATVLYEMRSKTTVLLPSKKCTMNFNKRWYEAPTVTLPNPHISCGQYLLQRKNNWILSHFFYWNHTKGILLCRWGPVLVTSNAYKVWALFKTWKNILFKSLLSFSLLYPPTI